MSPFVVGSWGRRLPELWWPPFLLVLLAVTRLAGPSRCTYVTIGAPLSTAFMVPGPGYGAGAVNAFAAKLLYQLDDAAGPPPQAAAARPNPVGGSVAVVAAAVGRCLVAADHLAHEPALRLLTNSSVQAAASRPSDMAAGLLPPPPPPPASEPMACSKWAPPLLQVAACAPLLCSLPILGG